MRSTVTMTLWFWRGNRAEKRENRHPSRAEVENAIRQLDQSTRTEVSLRHHDGGELTIGGGARRYYVSAILEPERVHVLTNPTAAGRKDELIVLGGQPSRLPASYVVGRKAAVQAASTFMERGLLDETQPWITQPVD
jgi:immunity protein Imm1 of predicted polymorphic toxin system